MIKLRMYVFHQILINSLKYCDYSYCVYVCVYLHKGCVNFAGKIIGIIGMQKQQAKCWLIGANSSKMHGV